METSLKLGNNMVLLSVKHKEKTMDRRVNKLVKFNVPSTFPFL